MKKIYHLATCTTCQGILDDFGKLAASFEKQDIKTQSISEGQLDQMKEMADAVHEADQPDHLRIASP